MGRKKLNNTKVYTSFSIPLEARQILQANADYAGISMSALLVKLIMAHDKLLKDDICDTQK